ncbi:hypothetical protein F5876DRAFT_65883 [Lentinula aff. lateritia]|uniref:Uncharacterized protein n=1 Tax=Lentinula aff. lateritia TaxID=2804960 RepID=A0ACC1TZN7_9AGAR|nr:hypothetical protein F5876DRAFT_65883 [Lentinula aff. lateritia]
MHKSGQKDCVTQSPREQSGRDLLVCPEEGEPKRQGVDVKLHLMGSPYRPSGRQTGVLASASMLGDAQNGRFWLDRKLKKRFICLGTPDRKLIKLIMTGTGTHLQFAGGDFLDDDRTGHGQEYFSILELVFTLWYLQLQWQNANETVRRWGGIGRFGGSISNILFSTIVMARLAQSDRASDFYVCIGRINLKAASSTLAVGY